MNTNITTNEHQESNEETGTQVEAVVEEQDELQRRFNIVPRFIEPERKKAAHDAWIEFCSQPMEPVMFIKLLGVCVGNVAEATVLWDILCYQRKQGLKRWKQPTGCYFTDMYGITFSSNRTFRNAMRDLGDDGLLIHWPVTEQASNKYRIDWVELYERMLKVDKRLAGLKAHHACPVEVV